VRRIACPDVLPKSVGPIRSRVLSWQFQGHLAPLLDALMRSIGGVWCRLLPHLSCIQDGVAGKGIGLTSLVPGTFDASTIAWRLQLSVSCHPNGIRLATPAVLPRVIEASDEPGWPLTVACGARGCDPRVWKEELALGRTSSNTPLLD
jgi:hypothetical protein